MRKRIFSLILSVGLAISICGVMTIPISVSAAGETTGNYYYDSFTKSEQALYDRIKTAVLDGENAVSVNGVTNDRAAELIGKIGDMLLFYDAETWNIKKLNLNAGTGGRAELQFDYYVGYDKFELMNAELTAVADEIAAETADLGTTQKLRYIHDFLLENCEYTLDTELSGTPYGALIEGAAKCDGYALAFQMIAERAGIPCVTAIAAPDSMGVGGAYGHAWNKVKVSKAWYNIDCSSDDTTLRQGGICYDWFMLADSEMGSIHEEWDDPFVTEPVADNKKNNYYEMKKLVAYTLQDAEALTHKLIKERGNTGDIAFEVPDKDVLDEYLRSFQAGLITQTDAELFVNPERQIVHISIAD
jgi:transglutaminase-like putative cysteine protease